MADNITSDIANPFSDEVVRAGPEPPRQGVGTYLYDTAINIGKAGVGAAESAAAAAGSKDNTDMFSDWKAGLGSIQSQRQQYVDRHPEKSRGGWVDDIVQAVIGLTPYVPVGIAAGAIGTAAAPVTGGLSVPAAVGGTFGALGYGSYRAKLREQIRFMPEDQLWQSTKYQRYRGEGLSDSEARDRLFDETNEVLPGLIAAGTGAIAGGVGMKVAGLLGGKKAAEAITRNVLARAGIGGAEAYGAGAIQIGGEDYALQTAKRQAGIGPTESLTEAAKLGLHEALPFIGVGAIAGAMHRPGRPATKPKPAAEAPPIGTEQTYTADRQLGESIANPTEYGPPNEPPTFGPRSAVEGDIQRVAPSVMTEADLQRGVVHPSDIAQPATTHAQDREARAFPSQRSYARAQAEGFAEEARRLPADAVENYPYRPGEQPFRPDTDEPAGPPPVREPLRSPERPFVPDLPEPAEAPMPPAGPSRVGEQPFAPDAPLAPEQQFPEARGRSATIKERTNQDLLEVLERAKAELASLKPGQYKRRKQLNAQIAELRTSLAEARGVVSPREKARQAAAKKAERERVAANRNVPVTDVFTERSPTSAPEVGLDAPRRQPGRGPDRALPETSNENEARIRGTLQGTEAQLKVAIDKAGASRTVDQERGTIAQRLGPKAKVVLGKIGSPLTGRLREVRREDTGTIRAARKITTIADAKEKARRLREERQRRREEYAERVTEVIDELRQKRAERHRLREAMYETMAEKRVEKDEETRADKKREQMAEEHAEVERRAEGAARHPKHAFTPEKLQEEISKLAPARRPHGVIDITEEPAAREGVGGRAVRPEHIEDVIGTDPLDNVVLNVVHGPLSAVIREEAVGAETTHAQQRAENLSRLHKVARTFIASAAERVRIAESSVRQYAEEQRDAEKTLAIRLGFTNMSGARNSYRNAIVEMKRFVRDARRLIDAGEKGRGELESRLNQQYALEWHIAHDRLEELPTRDLEELQAGRGLLNALRHRADLTDAEKQKLIEADERLQHAIGGATDAIADLAITAAEARRERELTEAGRPLRSQFDRPSGYVGETRTIGIPELPTGSALATREVLGLLREVLSSTLGNVSESERRERLQILIDKFSADMKAEAIDFERQRDPDIVKALSKRDAEKTKDRPGDIYFGLHAVAQRYAYMSERLGKEAYRRVFEAEGSIQDARAAAVEARGEWSRLTDAERDLIWQYEQGHITSIYSSRTIRQKIDFMKSLKERIDPDTFMHDQGQALLERAQQLYEAIELVRPDFEATLKGKELDRVYTELARALGESRLSEATVARVRDMMQRASNSLEEIETRMRAAWSMMEGAGKLPSYGITGLLEPGRVNLQKMVDRGTIPLGIRVSKVSDHFGPRSTTYGLYESMGGRMTAPLVRHFMEVANKLVGKMEIVEVTGEHMPQLATERNLPPEVRAFYDPTTNRIFITREAMRSRDRGRLLVHEVAHALTETALFKFPKLVQKFEEIRRILKGVYNNPNHAAHENVRNLLQHDDYGLRDVHEFISEFWANDKIAAALDEIETTPAQRKRWQTERKGLLSDMLQAVKNALLRVFGLGSQKRLLNDATVAGLDMLQKLQRGNYRQYVDNDSIARAAPIENRAPTTGREFVPELRKVLEESLRASRSIGTDYEAREIQRMYSHLQKGLDLVAPLVEDAKVIVGGNLKRDVLGRYEGGGHVVYLIRDASIATAVHELVHAATSRAMSQHPEFRRALLFVAKYVSDHPKFAEYMGLPTVHEANKNYFLRNEREFVAEFLSNHEVRELLDKIPLPAEIQRGISASLESPWVGGHSSKTLSVMQAVFKLIAAALNKMRGKRVTAGQFTDALLEDIFRAQKHLPASIDWSQFYANRENISHKLAAPGIVRDIVRDAKRGVGELGTSVYDRLTKAGGLAGLNRYGFFRNVAERVRMYEPQLAEKVDKIIDIVGKVGNTQEEIARTIDGPMLKRLAEATFKGKPDLVNDKLVDYVNLENYAGVAGNDPLFKGENAWVKADLPQHQQVIERHAALAAEWAKLSPEQQDVVKSLRKTLRDRHEEVLNATLKQIIETARFGDEKLLKKFTPEAVAAVMKKIRRQELTEADKAALKDDMMMANESDLDAVIKDRGWRKIPAFRQIDGPFYPMMRHGDWLVHGQYDLEKVAREAGMAFTGTEKTDGGRGLRFDFLTPEDRSRFVKWLSNHEDYDFKVTSAGKDSATVNIEHFSGHETSRAAENELAALRQDPNFIPSAVSVRRDAFTNYSAQSQQLKGVADIIRGMQNSPGFRALPESEQTKMVHELREVGMRYLLSDSARSKYMQRRYTKGASEDLNANVRKYLHNTSYTLADLRHRGEMLQAVEAFDNDIKARSYLKDKDGRDLPENERFAIPRSQVQREVHRRLAMRPEEHSSNWLNRATNRLTQLTNIAKLGSPSFHAMNATEPWALGGPIMAGDHGPRAYSELGKAYAIFGGSILRNIKNDVAAVIRQGIDGAPELTDHLKSLTDRVASQPDAPELVGLLNFLHQTQYLNRDAGFDVARHYDPAASTLGRLLDWVDSFQRAIGSAVESQNRATTAVAAYRLARDKMGVEEAQRYAQRVLEKSAGLYTWYNKPEIMNSANPLVRMAAQFRNYALRVTQNYALMTLGAYKALTRADVDNPGMHERNKMLARQLVMQMASQAVLSGLFGTAYWGPMGAAISASGLVTGFNSEDAEAAIRGGLADWVGPQWAEFIAHGGLRVLGSGFAGGLGERISHSSLWTYGALGQKPDDWYRATGNLLLGASGSTAFAAVDGLHGLFSGLNNYAEGRTSQGTEQVVEGIRKLVPIKVAADVLGVAHDTYWGKATPGGQLRAPPPDFSTGLSNVLGFRTGEQVERSEATGMFIRDRQRYNAAVAQLKEGYAKATSSSERTAVIRSLRGFNEGLPIEMKVTVADLLKYARTYGRKQQIDPDQLGLTTSRRTRPLLRQVQETYNFSQ